MRILKACASGGAPAIDENLSQLKGKGSTLAKGARRSPFKPFAEYAPSIYPDQVNLRQLDREEEDRLIVDELMAIGDLQTLVPRPVPTVTSSNLRTKQVLFTYSLAFQCVVNIGVRGSETIRTRVVEAGALDVVVNVLEKYLEDVARRKRAAEERHGKVDSADQGPATEATASSSSRRDSKVAEAHGRRRRIAQDTLVTSSSSGTALFQFTRQEGSNSGDSTAASSTSSSMTNFGMAPILARVSTPDTIVSMDETEGDTGSSSGQEQEEVTVVVLADTSSSRDDQPSHMRVVIKGASSEDNNVETSEAGDNAQAQNGESTGSDQEQHRLQQPTPISSRQQHPSSTLQQNASASGTPPSVSTDGALSYRDEDVLLSLQLLAYLSKYPHVRSVFHSPSDLLASNRRGHDHDEDCEMKDHDDTGVDQAKFPPKQPVLSSNVFSLVEAFTHRPHTNDIHTPRHSNEVQYWAGVIMRNACRKDESRGGIRQCANMECGRWEQYAREFAKCRRCRKAKYCSKTCQSSAWGKGHRYWCAKAAPKETAQTSSGGNSATEAAGPESNERMSALSSLSGAAPSHSHGDGTNHHHHHLSRRRRPTRQADADDDDELLPPAPPPPQIPPIIVDAQAGESMHHLPADGAIMPVHTLLEPMAAQRLRATVHAAAATSADEADSDAVATPPASNTPRIGSVTNALQAAQQQAHRHHHHHHHHHQQQQQQQTTQTQVQQAATALGGMDEDQVARDLMNGVVFGGPVGGGGPADADAMSL